VREREIVCQRERNTLLVREMEIEHEQVYITNESKGESVRVTQRKRVGV